MLVIHWLYVDTQCIILTSITIYTYNKDKLIHTHNKSHISVLLCYIKLHNNNSIYNTHPIGVYYILINYKRHEPCKIQYFSIVIIRYYNNYRYHKIRIVTHVIE